MLSRVSTFLLLALLISVCEAREFYAGAGVGVTRVEDETDGLSFEDSTLGWRLLGGYGLNESLAIEASYVNGGKADDTISGTEIEAEFSAITLSLVGMMPIGDNSGVFAKAGYFDGEQEVTAFDLTFDDEEAGLTLGIGYRLDLPGGYLLRADFDWYDTDLDSLWSAGMAFQYTFGD